MSCPGIPIFTAAPATCAHYTCQDDSTSPPTFPCVPMLFVFADHYVTKGVVLKNAAGGYVPAVTVCRMGIATDRISHAKASKSKYFGL